MDVGRKSRKDVAIQAAIAYYGLSSATRSFPKGVDVNVYDGKGGGELRGNVAKVAAEIDKVWNENIGGLSRTARLSLEDVAFYARRLGLKANEKSVEEWMKAIAESHPNVIMVMVKHNNIRKVLLVNTDVTQ